MDKKENFVVECRDCEWEMVETEIEDEVELEEGEIGNWHYYLCRRCGKQTGIFKEKPREEA